MKLKEAKQQASDIPEPEPYHSSKHSLILSCVRSALSRHAVIGLIKTADASTCRIARTYGRNDAMLSFASSRLLFPA